MLGIDSSIGAIDSAYGIITAKLDRWLEATSTDYYGAISDAVIAVKHAFDEHGIEIPFPIRTLDGSQLGALQLRGADIGDDPSPRPTTALVS